MTERVPDIRVSVLRDEPARDHGRYVLYWMIASRRTTWNFGLQRAVEWAGRLRRPLVVLEALRCDYAWNCDRLHHFVLDGMWDNSTRLSGSGVLYFPYVEPQRGAGKGLLAALARDACVVVTDEFPCTFLPRMVAAAARQVDCRLEQVDSNGLLPLRAAEVAFPTAYAFRRFLQRELPPHLNHFPEPDPLARAKLPPMTALPAAITARWAPAAEALLHGAREALSALPIDHSVPRAAQRGGAVAAHKAMLRFLMQRLPRYAEERNQPEEEVPSELSAYLHFGHLSVHQIFVELAERQHWSPEKLGAKASGQRAGWWGMDEAAEGFLDELITWREIGYNMCTQRSDYDQFESLPDWARRTLRAHEADPRDYLYTHDAFETAATHDPLWNAAQNQLRSEGRIHNYLRMLWGKKILEWSPSPAEALRTMIHLNNKYALDGRNPNSYSGIFWVLGRYDRPWGPERPIYGTVRYMSSANTARKVRVARYIEQYASQTVRQGELF